LIGGYFFRLASSSPTIRIAGSPQNIPVAEGRQPPHRHEGGARHGREDCLGYRSFSVPVIPVP
jgi:hypothetical protein